MRCSRCAERILLETSLTGQMDSVRFHEVENEVSRTQSKCHTIIIPRHHAMKKAVEGFAHMLTLGIPSFLDQKAAQL